MIVNIINNIFILIATLIIIWNTQGQSDCWLTLIKNMSHIFYALQIDNEDFTACCSKCTLESSCHGEIWLSQWKYDFYIVEH